MTSRRNRAFWLIVYRALLSVAQAIKTYHLSEASERPHDPDRAAGYFQAQHIRVLTPQGRPCDPRRAAEGYFAGQGIRVRSS